MTEGDLVDAVGSGCAVGTPPATSRPTCGGSPGDLADAALPGGVRHRPVGDPVVDHDPRGDHHQRATSATVRTGRAFELDPFQPDA